MRCGGHRPRVSIHIGPLLLARWLGTATGTWRGRKGTRDGPGLGVGRAGVRRSTSTNTYLILILSSCFTTDVTSCLAISHDYKSTRRYGPILEHGPGESAGRQARGRLARQARLPPAPSATPAAGLPPFFAPSGPSRRHCEPPARSLSNQCLVDSGARRARLQDLPAATCASIIHHHPVFVPVLSFRGR